MTQYSLLLKLKWMQRFYPGEITSIGISDRPQTLIALEMMDLSECQKRKINELYEKMRKIEKNRAIKT
tara:strand:+ start:41973 stop:42176 length:204 start_codon:yes stop_codon:yes gene_type:complete